MSEQLKKSKTKAKARYLKAKKDRRKRRKTDTPLPPKLSQNESEDEEEEEDVIVEDKPAPKRKRISPEPDVDAEMQADSDEEVHQRSPTPLATLPSFPLPVLPNAPSKSALALQGLDKALLDAEIIEPSRVVPVDSIGHDRNDGKLPVLSEKTKKRLHELGIAEFFAVQTALLPFLLPSQSRHRAVYCPYDPPRDVCTSAPTGSGKTLAYVIPIVEILSSRIVTRLRALVVLPTRDLVIQVQETFEALSKGRGLKIAVATGQHSFAHEQNQLIADQTTMLQGGSSKVDILICTPGRLIDHLNGTPNFSLQHLRFLVIDEADRLLAQSFQDWLAQVLAATRPPPRLSSLNPKLTHHSTDQESIPHHDALSPSFLHACTTIPDVRTDFDDQTFPSCQKLLFSATLTSDPSKIAAMGLRDAKYFIVHHQEKDGDVDIPAAVTEKFTMPVGLKEHMIVCETSQKPLMLFHLVHAHSVTNALVFTKSAESTTRLLRLFEFFEEARTAGNSNADTSTRRRTVVRTYSSDLSRADRKTILDQFKDQAIDILVCSDLISRGIDISHVSHVVSYDAPVDMRKYVHRVGRTARAGRSGDAWTLVEEQEARHFKQLLSGAGHLEQVKKLRVSEKDLKDLVPFYQVCLS
ncbi:DEAD-domain-containing protein [Rickenella mellea]|uniref:ATP-dependent RNA helicase n=1 Tax=Rickenella mellea TaxID=50990 RepID=A0A4Y7QFK8_9AGAM|nr:DEAD-domain-containing protein [Rickenella mellea]